MIDPFIPAFAQRSSSSHRRVDVIDGNRRDADQARGRDPEIVDQPVVVRAKAGLLKPRVVHAEVRQEIGRV